MSGRGYNRAAGSAQLTIEAAIKIDPMVLRQQIGEAKGEGFTTELALCCASGAVLVTVYRKSSTAPPRMYVLKAQAIVDAVLSVDDARSAEIGG